MRPLAVALLLWIGLVAAGTELQLIFKSSPAFTALNDNQRRCSASDVHSASRASNCRDKNCFCASPQTMSDDTDDCMLTLGGTYNVKDIYTADTYNGVMTFFANECGTFEVQLKVGACPGLEGRRSKDTEELTPRAGSRNTNHHIQDQPDPDQLWVRRKSDGRRRWGLPLLSIPPPLQLEHPMADLT